MPDPAFTVILTRPDPASTEFAGMLREAGFAGEIIISPVMEIEPSVGAPDFSDVHGVIFTSGQAVNLAPARSLPAWCVGQRTAELATAAGWKAQAADGDVDALYRLICADAPTGRLLHLAGEDTRGNLVNRLLAAGLDARKHVLYQQKPVPLNEVAKSALRGEKSVCLPLFSPNSARYVSMELPQDAQPYLVAMSAEIKKAISDRFQPLATVAPEVSARSMVDAVLALKDAV